MNGLIFSLLAEALRGSPIEGDAWEIVLGSDDWRDRLAAIAGDDEVLDPESIPPGPPWPPRMR
jgi:hypothetical protein